jgi:aspartyl-tRNA(Asn)/glutamyl-tRNA(Gln) amidotransferase subunit C
MAAMSPGRHRLAGRCSPAYSPDTIRRSAPPSIQEPAMSVDLATVKRVAHLARIAVPEADLPRLQGELNAILGFVEQLNEVDVSGVEPMTSVTPMAMTQREDIVTDGEIADLIVANAPASDDNYFMVPKVIE